MPFVVDRSIVSFGSWEAVVDTSADASAGASEALLLEALGKADELPELVLPAWQAASRTAAKTMGTVIRLIAA
jgi:hypothetical protein